MQLSKNKLIIALIIASVIILTSIYLSSELPLTQSIKELPPVILNEAIALFYEVPTGQWSLLAGPEYMGCSSQDNQCSIYAIARLNKEKYDLDIETRALAQKIVDKLKSRNEPYNPPRSWEHVLSAKRSVMTEKYPNGTRIFDIKYTDPKIIIGRGKQGGGEAEDVLVLSQQVVGSNLASAQRVVITVKWSDGFVHSMFCYVWNLNRKNGDGYYLCHDHLNQGGYWYSLNITNGNVTGTKHEPYPGPGIPINITVVSGTLSVLIRE